MIRNHFSSFALLSLASLAEVGCSGKPAEPDFIGRSGAMVVAQFGKPSPLYFNVTNTMSLNAATPSAGSFLLGAGARVQLEAATSDGAPLRLELHRVRRDGTAELLAPVDVASGFYLTTFEATSDGEFVLWFPAPRDAVVAVRLECEGGEGRCSPMRQPGESCAPGYSCDEGLDCLLPYGECDKWIYLGACTKRADPTDCAPIKTAPQTAPAPAQATACGCDAKTYENECLARAAGVGVAAIGACGESVDARTN